MLPPIRCSLLIKTVCWLQAPVIPILETFATSTPPPIIIIMPVSKPSQSITLTLYSYRKDNDIMIVIIMSVLCESASIPFIQSLVKEFLLLIFWRQKNNYEPTTEPNCFV